MCYQKLLEIGIDEISSDKICQYFKSLNIREREKITFFKFQRAIALSEDETIDYLNKMEKAELLSRYFILICPNCGTIVKTFNNYQEIEGISECYSCDEPIIKDDEHIDLRYKLNEQKFPFDDGQQTLVESVSIEDVAMLERIKNVKNINGLFYTINNQTRDTLLNDIDEIYAAKSNKNKGTTLERFVINLFNCIHGFNCRSERFKNNQIDCFIKNGWHIYILKYASMFILAECKNETCKPGVEYVEKLQGIINSVNSKGSEHYKFAIVISKKEAAKTFADLAKRLYLTNSSYIINVTLEEIRQMLNKNSNLIDLLDDKFIELTK